MLKFRSLFVKSLPPIALSDLQNELDKINQAVANLTHAKINHIRSSQNPQYELLKTLDVTDEPQLRTLFSERLDPKIVLARRLTKAIQADILSAVMHVEELVKGMQNLTPVDMQKINIANIIHFEKLSDDLKFETLIQVLKTPALLQNWGDITLIDHIFDYFSFREGDQNQFSTHLNKLHEQEGAEICWQFVKYLGLTYLPHPALTLKFTIDKLSPALNIQPEIEELIVKREFGIN